MWVLIDTMEIVLITTVHKCRTIRYALLSNLFEVFDSHVTLKECCLQNELDAVTNIVVSLIHEQTFWISATLSSSGGGLN